MLLSPATRLEETALWIELLEKESSAGAHGISEIVRRQCERAAQRMKLVPAYAPQYTLHDEQHLLRAVDLMGRILGDTLHDLNAVELVLLILGGYYHDQGMVPAQADLEKLTQEGDFLVGKETWIASHPNYGEVDHQSQQRFISEEERRELAGKLAELEAAFLTEYLRKTHAERSERLALELLGSDVHLEIAGVNLARLVGLLCRSHVVPVASIAPADGFNYDEQVGAHTANMVFLALVLRLADLLDFDRERTPDVLYSSIHFTDRISLQEWEKHRAVQGWSISPDEIRFTAQCTHPAYEKAIREFIGYIDDELTACASAARSQPAGCTSHGLLLPQRVSQDRIGPADRLYRYHDLSFELQRDEIVHLLMTDNLYDGPHICIRELLQNSLDALRYRRALHLSAHAAWDAGAIKITHSRAPSGYEIVECIDNGVGMDEEIVTKYLTKVGRSYYRSPEFERERIRLTQLGLGFDPCSRFGIGFMSCFMVGDRILIKTRRDYGPGRDYGDPLEVEINGLSGLVVIRDGDESQEPGTSVSITSRRRLPILDVWTDEVRLTSVLRGYALATEFPIEGICTVPGVEDCVEIPTSCEPLPTFLETAAIARIRRIDVDLAEIDPDLGGRVSESFLIDGDGRLCLGNDEACWTVSGVDRKDPEWVLERQSDGERSWLRARHDSQICADGVLVGGPPGRGSSPKLLSGLLGSRASQVYSCSSVLADARGGMKPELTPSRMVPDRWSPPQLRYPGWRRLEAAIGKARGRLWEMVLRELQSGLRPETLWQLASLYGVHFEEMRHREVMARLVVSLTSATGLSRWESIANLGALRMLAYGEREGSFELVDDEGRAVGPAPELRSWEATGTKHEALRYSMNMIVALASQVDASEGAVTLRPAHPDGSDDTLATRVHTSHFGPVHRFDLPFIGTVADAITVEAPFQIANLRHPLVRLANESRFLSELSSIQEYARTVSSCLPWLACGGSARAVGAVSRGQKMCAYLYDAIDWRRYDTSLRPPYKYWTRGGWKAIGEEEFDSWRVAPLAPD